MFLVFIFHEIHSLDLGNFTKQILINTSFFFLLVPRSLQLWWAVSAISFFSLFAILCFQCWNQFFKNALLSFCPLFKFQMHILVLKHSISRGTEFTQLLRGRAGLLVFFFNRLFFLMYWRLCCQFLLTLSPVLQFFYIHHISRRCPSHFFWKHEGAPSHSSSFAF